MNEILWNRAKPLWHKALNEINYHRLFRRCPHAFHIYIRRRG